MTKTKGKIMLESIKQNADTGEQIFDDRLKSHVEMIIDHIENGYIVEDTELHEGYEEGDTLSAFDYIEGYYDVEYYVSSDRKTVLGARFMVACGGPNIYIDTRFKEVQGYWWSDKYIARYHNDEMGLDEVAQELWGC